ncbi:uncharacterized protein LOC144903728 [Branchiostoma floridae x Branchiostoma belcheri]
MAVLLLNDYWKRNEKGRQKLNEINTNLAKHLQKEKVKTYTTTLALTEQDDDLKHAKTKGVIVLQPKTTKRVKESNIDWLGEYHDKHFPDLPEDIGCIVCYSVTTLEVASILKDAKYPHCKLIGINTSKLQHEPENEEHYDYYNNVDVVFSCGKAAHTRFETIKRQKNLPPDAKVYNEVDVIKTLCGGLGGNQKVSTGQCEEIEMHDVASASFQSASQNRPGPQ